MVTIAIPFFNAEKYLLDAVRSVFAQTYKNWELILIDDGSTDKSLAIAKLISDPRVRVYSDGKNKKLAARLNEVTLLATYDYILRMDADDLMMPNRIEKQLELLTNNDVDIVTTGVYSVKNNLKILGIRGSNFESVNFRDLISRKVGITHAALLAKKSWYQRNKYDESLSIAQDLDLWLRTSKKNDLKILSIAEPLYIYREEGNVSKVKLIRAYRNERVMIRKYNDTFFNFKIFKTFLKSLVVQLLSLVGKIDILQKNRGNIIITSESIFYFNEAIDLIKSTKIPGVDE
jgi:glycosyltransferase involved in cell wall biosynthesis